MTDILVSFSRAEGEKMVFSGTSIVYRSRSIILLAITCSFFEKYDRYDSAF